MLYPTAHLKEAIVVLGEERYFADGEKSIQLEHILEDVARRRETLIIQPR